MTVYSLELHAWVREITSTQMTDQTIVVHLKLIFQVIQVNGVTHLDCNICNSEMIKSDKPDDTDPAELM